jgi:hypothetical protein
MLFYIFAEGSIILPLPVNLPGNNHGILAGKYAPAAAFRLKPSYRKKLES